MKHHYYRIHGRDLQIAKPKAAAKAWLPPCIFDVLSIDIMLGFLIIYYLHLSQLPLLLPDLALLRLLSLALVSSHDMILRYYPLLYVYMNQNFSLLQ